MIDSRDRGKLPSQSLASLCVHVHIRTYLCPSVISGSHSFLRLNIIPLSVHAVFSVFLSVGRQVGFVFFFFSHLLEVFVCFPW